MDKVWAIRPEKPAKNIFAFCKLIGPLYFPVEVYENTFDLSLAKVAKMSEKGNYLDFLIYKKIDSCFLIFLSDIV